MTAARMLVLAYFVCWAKPYDAAYKGPWYYGWGQTEAAAKQEALGFCGKRTGRECYATCKRVAKP